MSSITSSSDFTSVSQQDETKLTTTSSVVPQKDQTIINFEIANNVARAKAFLESFNTTREIDKTFNENYNQLKSEHKNIVTSSSLFEEYLKASEESTGAVVNGIPDDMDDSTMNQSVNHINSLLDDFQASLQ